MLEELEDNSIAVGIRVKFIRLAMGYAQQKDFAEKIGISKQSYNQLEGGKRELSLSVAKSLRTIFGAPLEFLYFGRTQDLPARLYVKLPELQESLTADVKT